jgi:hypothetical protein
MADPVGLGAVGVTTVAVKASGCSISVAMAIEYASSSSYRSWPVVDGVLELFALDR